jgi:hypothetical protein
MRKLIAYSLFPGYKVALTLPQGEAVFQGVLFIFDDEKHELIICYGDIQLRHIHIVGFYSIYYNDYLNNGVYKFIEKSYENACKEFSITDFGKEFLGVRGINYFNQIVEKFKRW